MRSELEHIELIENYLLDQMTPEDKLAFEAQILVDSELSGQVDFQRQMMGRIGVVTMRQQVDLAHHRFIAGRSGWGWGNWLLTITLVGLIVVAGVFFFQSPPEKPKQSQMVEPVEVITESVPKALNYKERLAVQGAHVYQQEDDLQKEGNTASANNTKESTVQLVEDEYDSLVKPKSSPPPAQPLNNTEFHFNFNAESGGHFNGGTMFIHIPPFAFKDRDKYVRGNIQLILTELRTEAEMIVALANGDGFATRNFSKKTHQGMFSLHAYHGGKQVEWTEEVPVYVELPVQGDGKNLALEYFEYKEKNDWVTLCQLKDMELDHELTSEIGEEYWEAMYYPLKKRFARRLSDRIVWREAGKKDDASRVPWDSEEDKRRKKARKQVDYLPEENRDRSKYYHYKGIKLNSPGLYALTESTQKEELVSKNITPLFVAEDHYVKGANRIFYIDRNSNAIQFRGFTQTIPYYPDGEYDMLIMTSFHRRYLVKCEDLPNLINSEGEVEIAVKDITGQSKTHEDLQKEIRFGVETWEEKAIREYINRQASFKENIPNSP